MKTVRKYRVVKTDLSGFLKFVCIDVPRASVRYIEKSAIPKNRKLKVNDVVKFKRYTTRSTTKWVLA